MPVAPIAPAVQRSPPVIPVATIIEAIRIWRTSREAHLRPQPRLHALLAPIGHDMMAPVIDSVLQLAERCLGRPSCRDCPFGTQSDVELLVELLRDPGRMAAMPRCARGDDEAEMVFAGALASAGAMMAMAMA